MSCVILEFAVIYSIIKCSWFFFYNSSILRSAVSESLSPRKVFERRKGAMDKAIRIAEEKRDQNRYDRMPSPFGETWWSYIEPRIIMLEAERNNRSQTEGFEFKVICYRHQNWHQNAANDEDGKKFCTKKLKWNEMWMNVSQRS